MLCFHNIIFGIQYRILLYQVERTTCRNKDIVILHPCTAGAMGSHLVCLLFCRTDSEDITVTQCRFRQFFQTTDGLPMGIDIRISTHITSNTIRLAIRFGIHHGRDRGRETRGEVVRSAEGVVMIHDIPSTTRRAVRHVVDRHILHVDRALLVLGFLHPSPLAVCRIHLMRSSAIVPFVPTVIPPVVTMDRQTQLLTRNSVEGIALGMYLLRRVCACLMFKGVQRGRSGLIAFLRDPDRANGFYRIADNRGVAIAITISNLRYSVSGLRGAGQAHPYANRIEVFQIHRLYPSRRIRRAVIQGRSAVGIQSLHSQGIVPQTGSRIPVCRTGVDIQIAFLTNHRTCDSMIRIVNSISLLITNSHTES